MKERKKSKPVTFFLFLTRTHVPSSSSSSNGESQVLLNGLHKQTKNVHFCPAQSIQTSKSHSFPSLKKLNLDRGHTPRLWASWHLTLTVWLPLVAHKWHPHFWRTHCHCFFSKMGETLHRPTRSLLVMVFVLGEVKWVEDKQKLVWILRSYYSQESIYHHHPGVK